jgi:hypothetical protein
MELFCFSLFIAGVGAGVGGGTPAVCSSAADTSLPVTIALEKWRNDYINKYMNRDCSRYLLRGKWKHRGRQFGCEWSDSVWNISKAISFTRESNVTDTFCEIDVKFCLSPQNNLKYQ